jgi:ubiquinone/menaquinone biosynthesis C-methylase UbiE
MQPRLKTGRTPMARDDIERRIEEAARSFDAELHTKAFAETHSDTAQLARMLSFLSTASGQRILDLGTGNGYVAKSIADKIPDCHVIGIDVARKAIETNQEQARAQGWANLEFLTYDGITLPFADDYFDAAVSRYVFHHLPRPEVSLAKLGRAVRHGGKLVLADAVRHEADDVDFINRFQELKRDGHIRMYYRAEFVECVCEQEFDVIDTFASSISFTRERNAEYDELLAATPENVLKAYAVKTAAREIDLTFPILNAVFANRKSSP